MSIKEQLSQLIDDPEKLDAILKLTEGRLSPQQRYMRSEKGKEAKRRSNQKYAAKPKTVTPDIAERYIQHWRETAEADAHRSLTEIWSDMKEWAQNNNIPAVKMLEFKAQLDELAIPIVTSYMSEGKRVHRKVYHLICDPE